MDIKKLSTTKISEVYKRLKINQCYVCQARSANPLCSYCMVGFPVNLNACTLCQKPLSQQQGFLCGQCQTNPPSFDICMAPLRFDGIVKSLIHAIKFQQSAYYIHPFVQLMCEHLLSRYQDKDAWPAEIVYVPSHPNRIRQRGFCQTQLIASELQKALKQTLGEHAPKLTKPNPLIKHIDTQAQHALDRKSRLKTPQKAYRVEGKVSKHIALLDDVMTTGSTLEHCAKQLKKSGANRIDVWVLARTPDKTD